MSNRDRALGMDRDISRRDFVNGVAMVAGSLALPLSALGAEAERAPQSPGAEYPPARLGLRGSHPGSFEVAHAMRQGGPVDIAGAHRTGETYDLVVVGGGLSGLAAAHFFLKNAGPQARVLVLDNHDDFGGHAKRNELSYQGKLLAINGGTLEIESPARYNQWARELLRDIGVDLDRYLKANAANERLYGSLGLRNAHFFDRETFGVDRLVVAPPAPRVLADGPFQRRSCARHAHFGSGEAGSHAAGGSQSAGLYGRPVLRAEKGAPGSHQLPGLPTQRRQSRRAGVLVLHGDGGGCFGSAATRCRRCSRGRWARRASTGLSSIRVRTDCSRIFRWPAWPAEPERETACISGRQCDAGAPAGALADSRCAARHDARGSRHGRVNYSLLDRASNAARIRLNSTVVNVRHDGDPASAKEVIVTYSKDGQLYGMRGQACIMACWNMFIPYLAPELPAAQKQALAHNVKAPIVYTNVFLRNWRAFEKTRHQLCRVPDDVSRYRRTRRSRRSRRSAPRAQSGRTDRGAPDPNARIARITSQGAISDWPCGSPGDRFETFEYNIRDQLARILSPGGFDPARDIVGIAVNRWPHGYSYTYNSLYDPLEWVFTETAARPCVIARQPYGLISIANADAAASPHTDAAILEAHRAVSEVLERRAFPFVPRGTRQARA